MPVLEQGSTFNLPIVIPDLTGANAEVLKEPICRRDRWRQGYEAVLKRPVAEAGIVPAGLPRVPQRLQQDLRKPDP